MRNIFSQIFLGIIPTIHCCTSQESEHLGIFLMELFRMINRFAEEGVWKAECAPYEGFRRLVGDPPKLETLTLEQYKKGNQLIQSAFARNLAGCLHKPREQFMKARCALQILFRIRHVFPKDTAIAE
jgi:hypothetical protein|tara:strand:+ start:277 stop:657 length:381 start_codon:yes stop_codon:yes gene_type:complete